MLEYSTRLKDCAHLCSSTNLWAFFLDKLLMLNTKEKHLIVLLLWDVTPEAFPFFCFFLRCICNWTFACHAMVILSKGTHNFFSCWSWGTWNHTFYFWKAVAIYPLVLSQWHWISHYIWASHFHHFKSSLSLILYLFAVLLLYKSWSGFSPNNNTK